MKCKTPVGDTTRAAAIWAVRALVAYAVATDLAALPESLGSSILPSDGTFAEALRSAVWLRLPAEIVAAACLLPRAGARGSRAKVIEFLNSGVFKFASAVAVLPVLAVQIAAAAAVVLPFYAPLFTKGAAAFVAGLPRTPDARAALLSHAGTPLGPHAVAVYAAWRAVRPACIAAARAAVAGASRVVSTSVRPVGRASLSSR
jgi:hypothetical protein